MLYEALNPHFLSISQAEASFSHQKACFEVLFISAFERPTSMARARPESDCGSVQEPVFSRTTQVTLKTSTFFERQNCCSNLEHKASRIFRRAFLIILTF